VKEISVPLGVSEGKVKVHEHKVEVPYYHRLRNAHLSQRQRAEFEQSSIQVADAQTRNEILKRELEFLEARLEKVQPDRAESEFAAQSQLYAEIQSLRNELAIQSAERDNVRDELMNPPTIEYKDVHDEAGLAELESDTHLVEDKNQELRQFISEAENNREEKAHHQQILNQSRAKMAQIDSVNASNAGRFNRKQTMETTVVHQTHSPGRTQQITKTYSPRREGQQSIIIENRASVIQPDYARGQVVSTTRTTQNYSPIRRTQYIAGDTMTTTTYSPARLQEVRHYSPSIVEQRGTYFSSMCQAPRATITTNANFSPERVSDGYRTTIGSPGSTGHYTTSTHRYVSNVGNSEVIRTSQPYSRTLARETYGGRINQ